MIEKRQAPPLGLKPKWIHDAQRIREIFEAMERYSDAEKPIPREWIDELRELVTNCGAKMEKDDTNEACGINRLPCIKCEPCCSNSMWHKWITVHQM